MRKKISDWAGLVSLMLIVLAFAITPAEAVQYANLYVHVTDCANGQALPNSYVSISGPDYRTGYTNSEGTILFSGIRLVPGPTERYSIDVSRDGYSPKNALTYVQCGQTHHQYICLNRNIICGVELSNTQASNNQIASVVKNTGNSPQEISVNFYVGGYLIGTKSISLSPGASQSVSQNHLFACGAHNIKVEAIADCGSRAEGHTNYNLQCNCPLTVNVVDENRNPIEAGLYIDGAYRRLGSFLSTEVSAGSHSIEARKTGYATAFQNVLCSSGESINAELILSKQKCSIEVHVKTIDGYPISQALVSLNSAKQLTQSNGVTVFEDLSPGRHSISASKQGYLTDSVSVECNAGERKIAELFLKGQEGNLKVHVSECLTGNAIVGADVDVISGVNVRGVTNTYGYAYFSGLPKGSYEVSANMEGYYSNYKDYVAVYDDRMTVVDVCLKKEFIPEEDGKCSLRIHVRDSEGQNTASQIYIDGRYYTRNDFYKIDLKPDIYEIKAQETGYKTAVQSFECVGGQTQSVYLLLEDAKEAKDNECTFRIYTRDKTDYLLKSHIYLNGRYEGYASYIEQKVSVGTHTIKATKEGYTSSSTNAQCYGGETRTIHLTLRGGEDDAQKDCEIRVYVRDENNSPLQARIYAENAYEGYYDYKRVFVEEGTRTIWVQREGYESQTKSIYCRPDRVETVYFYLKKSGWTGIDAVEITEINIEPSDPKLGDMVRGEVRIALRDPNAKNEAVSIKIEVDGVTIKSATVRFDYGGQEKIITFSLDTSGYEIGQRAIKVTAEIRAEQIIKTRNFRIYSRSGGDTPYPYPSQHCLRINEIEIVNKPAVAGKAAEFRVIVENCGEFNEIGINLKLENSDVQFASQFSLERGKELPIAFQYNVDKKETLKFTVWNAHAGQSKEYEIIPESGHLAIYLNAEYRIKAREDNKISFRVKNIGRAEDTFELSLSENIRPWIYGLPESLTLKSQEEAVIEFYVNPGSDVGTHSFNLESRTKTGDKSASSKFRVFEPFTLPTGAFLVAFHSALPWLWWLLWLLLIILLLLIIWWLLRKLWLGKRKGSKKPAKTDEKEAVRKANGEEKSLRQIKSSESYETERIARRVELERRNALIWDAPYPETKTAGRKDKKRPCGKKFWWDKDCVDDQEILPSKKPRFSLNNSREENSKDMPPERRGAGKDRMDELYRSLREI
jgi:uncharacterized membrane protein